MKLLEFIQDNRQIVITNNIKVSKISCNIQVSFKNVAAAC